MVETPLAKKHQSIEKTLQQNSGKSLGSPTNASKNNPITKKHFVSAQRRYDNVRVRDAELQKRVCLECGAVMTGAESEYQKHLLEHDSVYLIYQLDCFERFGPSSHESASTQSTEQQKLTKQSIDPRQKKPQKRKQESIGDGNSKMESLKKQPTKCDMISKIA